MRIVKIIRKYGYRRRSCKLGVRDTRVLCVFKRALCRNVERFGGVLVEQRATSTCFFIIITIVFARFLLMFKNALAQNLFARVNPRDPFVWI